MKLTAYFRGLLFFFESDLDFWRKYLKSNLDDQIFVVFRSEECPVQSGGDVIAMLTCEQWYWAECKEICRDHKITQQGVVKIHLYSLLGLMDLDFLFKRCALVVRPTGRYCRCSAFGSAGL